MQVVSGLKARDFDEKEEFKQKTVRIEVERREFKHGQKK